MTIPINNINSNAPIPSLPRNMKMVGEDGMMIQEWRLFFSQLIQALQASFKLEGIVVPPQTAAEIAALTAITSHNNIVYDSTNNLFKGNVNGTWKTFTLT